MQNLRRVGKNYGPIWSRLRSEVHVGLRGYWRLLVVCNVLDRLYVSFWRYRPLKLPLSCEVVQKGGFRLPISRGGDIPDVGLLNYTYFRPCGRFSLSSVQRARRLEGENKKNPWFNISLPTTMSGGLINDYLFICAQSSQILHWACIKEATSTPALLS